jgi:hypothetical protein
MKKPLREIIAPAQDSMLVVSIAWILRQTEVS